MSNSERRKIIDCFTFYNELEMLYCRLNLLYTVVDHFIIVEAKQTYMGNPKPLFYQNNSYLFKKFHDKIIHIVIDLPCLAPIDVDNKNEQWINENYQRNNIDNGIKQLSLSDRDLITITDLDEFTDPNFLIFLQNKHDDELADGLIALSLDMYYYNLCNRHLPLWILPKIVTYKKYKTTTPQEIRFSPYNILFSKCGWHLSYFGDVNFIKNKIIQFANQEFNSDIYTDENAIEDKIKNCKDLFNREYVPFKYIKTEENDFLPQNYKIYLNKYCNIDKNNDIVITNNQKIVVYFNILCINNWDDIVSNLLFKIRHSGLYNKLFEIRCVISDPSGLYNKNKTILEDEKIKIIHIDASNNPKKITEILYADSQLDDFYVLHLYSKGVEQYKSWVENNVYDWTEYMSYFNIYNYEKCITELDKGYNSVGVNLISNEGSFPLHYSGNFWWSKSSHIRNLNINLINNINPEFWVTSHSEGHYQSLWNSGKDHFCNPYKYTEYEKNI